MRFYLIDKITKWDVGKSAEGVKVVSMSEDFFNDHFPRYPIMPGVLVLEALAQLAGLLLEATVEKQLGIHRKALISILDKVKFRNISQPGDVLTLKAIIESVHEDSGKLQTSATVKDKRIAETSMTFVLTEYDDPELELKREQLLKFWLEGVG